MIITCTKAPRALVAEAALQLARENYEEADQATDLRVLNLIKGVQLDVRDEMLGYDNAPVLVSYGCGFSFEVDVPSWRWDVNTVVDGNGSELVVERHVSVMCPRCGRQADFLTESVDVPYVFEHQGMSKSERAALSDPALVELLADLPEERRQGILDRVLAAARGLLIDDSGSVAIYSHVTEGAVALSAATAKSVIGAKAGSAAGLQWTGYTIAFDGVTASAVPVLVEFGYCTFGANSPGTNSTGTTERQKNGRVITADWTGGRNWTTEPTTITVIGEGLLTPNGGLIVYDDPLGKEADSAVSEGFVIRLNAPATVNVRATQLLAHL